ncbi:hypothetical protein CPB86DRAFT_817865 [Serendipita vermifera]|nr:hypothetical protein CPB86DRAFT_817865 [Serendipita vermifera]
MSSDDPSHNSDGELELSSLPTANSSAHLDSRPLATPLTARTIRSFAGSLFPRAPTEGNSSFQSDLARIAFSLCFEEGCILFLLVMCQAANILDSNTRKFHWDISLMVLVFMVLVIIPLIQCLLFTYRAGTRGNKQLRTRIALTATPFLLYLFAFSLVPLPQHLDKASFFTKAVARMTVLGTLLLGLLSGFGAVSTAWSFQPFIGSKQDVSERDINSASAALERVRSDLRNRQEEARRTGVSESSRSWLPTRLFKGGAESALLQELDGLVALENQMTRNLEALRSQRAEIEFRRTWQGRLWTIIGRAFAIYCVFRIISSIRNVLFGPTAEAYNTSSPDIITYLLAKFVALFPSIPLSPVAVASLSRQISLLLVGCIILISVRTILRQVGQLIKSSSRTIGAAFLLLFLAQLMGTYLLSTLIQLRSAFPPNSHQAPPPTDHIDTIPPRSENDPQTNLFSSLPEYQLFGLLFDGSFLAAAAATAAMIWAHRQLNRAEIFT